MKEMPPISCCPGTRAGGFAALGIALAVLIITSDKANARSSSSEGAEVDGKPSQVHLTLTPNDDEMIVWWTTQRKTGPSTVQYGTSENNLDNTEVVHDEPTYYEEPWKPFGQYRSNYIHEVTICLSYIPPSAQV